MQNLPKEWNRIDKIKSLVQRHNPNTVVGLGDDGFVFRNFPGLSVIAQDMMIEEVHFSFDYTSASDLGHKILAVNLSDLAAMGATAHFAQVSLGLPAHLTQTWLDEFYQGMTQLGDQFQVEIVGGDLCLSPKATVVDVSVYGSCETPFTRGNVQPGQLLLASGPLGLSHAGLLALQNKIGDRYPESVLRHKRPIPRLDLVSSLHQQAHAVRALMDCSDGLINDVTILAHNRLGFQVWADQALIHPEVAALAKELGTSPTDFVLWGGEDYQLLLVVDETDRDRFPEWNVLGQFTEAPVIAVREEGKVRNLETFKGWKHFG